ncbi:Gfo/Idh/MocA family protein [Anaerotalea alkaliphila]|uniref:Gfo/Idh/MocA family oxidoreductase n=1 Tax=Anaerotalea alkaliphila TaxID=2662126 RepID=A0A7X5KN04_9FIRM|nr:Gfo/Idh/MocA family oxidoreductase [Anaerotalea alkaliphila]NDL67263.1 Gfo/Idh/MocA family oxidoreductase [Anaerotalea alkaliphila]
MKKFKVGVLGLGDISDVYISNLQNYAIVEVAACASRGLEKAQAKAARHGIPKAYASPAELLSDPEIDIILNLTLPEVHGSLNLAALEAGKHVYSEKPLAATLEEAKKVMDLAKRKGLSVCCAPDTFLGSRLQTCRQLIDEGRIGRVTGAAAFVVSHGHEWHHPNPDFFYRRGAGPLLDIGPYYITALLSLLGPVRSCCAMANRAFDRRTIESEPRKGETIPVEVDTHISGSLAFESGVVATVLASFDVWDSELPRMEIYGTEGTLCLRDIDPLDGPNLFGGEILLRTRENYRWKGMPRPEELPDWEKVPVKRPFSETSHRKNSRGIGLVDMAYALRDGRPARAGGEMAYHSLEVMEGLLQSAEAGYYHQVKSTFQHPELLPVDFPGSEG